MVNPEIWLGKAEEEESYHFQSTLVWLRVTKLAQNKYSNLRFSTNR